MKYTKWNSLKNRPKYTNIATITFLISFIFIFMSSCKGQSKKEKENVGLLISDTTNKPQVNVKVNKQYDKNGKIVKYDSTYSYVYKGSSGGTIPLNNDSVFSNFKSYFNIHSPGMFDMQNKNIFFNDSLFKYDFFNDDYFQKRFELNQRLFGDFYKQLDSMKGDYLKRTYPDKKPKGDH
jgi:hypothetical protein